ncbi:MAG: ATP synthase F1 subunit delta [Fibrobacter sp.]|nr:ATP synthase F1 subunit delta [Fibrobacter sp.]
MKNPALANRYAQTLLKFDTKGKSFENSKVLSDILQKKEISVLLKNPRISPEDKINAIIKALPYLNEHFKTFLNLIAKKKRLGILEDIVKAYIELYENKKGIKRGTLTSAIPLTDEQKNKIKQKFKNKTGMEYYFEEVLEPEIIGGLKIQIDDTAYDWTLKSQLNSLHKRFSSRAG